MSEWKNVLRPGYLGSKREATFAQFDQQYGKGNWRLAWRVGETFVEKHGAYALYEDAYYRFITEHHDIREQLINEACEVYDDAPTNVASGLDYNVQETGRTHLQDIAIRRSLIRLGMWFRGRELMQIRDHEGTHPLSMLLSPGQVPFHFVRLLELPIPNGGNAHWYRQDSVEDFYQRNRWLQVRE